MVGSSGFVISCSIGSSIKPIIQLSLKAIARTRSKKSLH